MLLYLVLLIAVTADAWRDAWLQKPWWERHAPKWIGFYLPLIYILYTHGYFEMDRLTELGVLAALALMWWKTVYDTLQNF